MARVLSLITSQDGQERETPVRMLCYAAGRMVGGVESARRRPVLAAALVDRGEYIRNVLPRQPYVFSLSLSLAVLYFSRHRHRHYRRLCSSRRRRRESSTHQPPLPTALRPSRSPQPSLPNTRDLSPSHRPCLSPSVIRVCLSSSIQWEREKEGWRSPKLN